MWWSTCFFYRFDTALRSLLIYRHLVHVHLFSSYLLTLLVILHRIPFAFAVYEKLSSETSVDLRLSRLYCCCFQHRFRVRLGVEGGIGPNLHINNSLNYYHFHYLYFNIKFRCYYRRIVHQSTLVVVLINNLLTSVAKYDSNSLHSHWAGLTVFSSFSIILLGLEL